MSLYDFFVRYRYFQGYVNNSAHSLNNGDIPIFIFIRAHYITSMKQWESKRIIRTLLLQHWSRVTYQKAHVHLKRYDEVDNHPF